MGKKLLIRFTICFHGNKYLIFNLVFSTLVFWSGNFFLIAPFPDLCLLVLFPICCSLVLRIKGCALVMKIFVCLFVCLFILLLFYEFDFHLSE